MSHDERGCSAGPTTGEQTSDDSDDAAGPTYDPAADVYVSTFVPRETSASVALMEVMADIRHCSTLDIDPLYEAVDGDALDSLVRSAGPSASVRFTLDGFGVLVSGDGRIEVTPPEIE